MTFSVKERQRLVTSFLELGGDAPTLCDGWTAHHLAAHLLIRESQPLATLGMFVPALQPILRRAMKKQLQRPFSDVVQQWGRGPRGLWRLADTRANVAEHFVHHEDLRRAQGFGPRNLDAEDTAELVVALRNTAFLLGPSPAVVELWPAGFDPVVAGDTGGTDRVKVFGEPDELLLYMYGRPAVGLDFVGDQSLVERRKL